MIDAHIHTGTIGSRPAQRARYALLEGTSKDDVAEYVKRRNFDKAWLLGCDGASAGATDEFGDPLPMILNCEVWEMYRDYPEKYVPGFSLNPGITRIQERIEKLANLGFRVFGEFKVPDLRFDDAKCEAIYEVLEEYGIPILFHIGRSGFSETQFDAFKRMFAKYKNLTFVAHSMGWWKYISADWMNDIDADYPSGPVKEPSPVAELFDAYPNLFANLDMIEGSAAMVRDIQHADRFLHKYGDRLLFGSDFPVEEHVPDWLQPRMAQWTGFRDALCITPSLADELDSGYRDLAILFRGDTELRQRVFHDNAERLVM